MWDYERQGRQLQEATDEAMAVMRKFLRQGSPEVRLKLALDILRIRGRSSVKALAGPGDGQDEAMARDLAEWILVTARADPVAYEQLRQLHAAVRRRRRRGEKKAVESGLPGLTAGEDIS